MISPCRLLLAIAAILVAALPATVQAESQPVTGSYVFADLERESRIDIHVAADGAVTGLHYPAGSGFPVYFAGTYADGVATGRYYTPTTILNIVFRFEFADDVLTQYIHYSQDELPEPVYLLRRPGPGPAEPITAPLDVLLRQGNHDAVIATSDSGSELQLRDARAIVDLLNLVISEAGLGSPAFTGRFYVDQLARIKSSFLAADEAVQLMLADSDGWWPTLGSGWHDVPAATRNRIAADVLLFAFEFEDLASRHQDPDLVSKEPGSCTAIASCIGAAADLTELARARAPCFRTEGCGE